ncbi:phosphate ABC transporter membrane protein 2 (PhoT family) [Micromonospora pisi]|uniref:Phosphate transport system permease protein PstA n=1 Tax=Micromonospora pisi TaxID=589240 RepID=A0A495JL12_9ACTN|nr:phosphate ABC transporter permease PstA [Micromonospora pisi]RKR89696.1 phosphate ABC transporter membrane protein 2 (PhoT family) [Micromonospora pisi]
MTNRQLAETVRDEFVPQTVHLADELDTGHSPDLAQPATTVPAQGPEPERLEERRSTGTSRRSDRFAAAGAALAALAFTMIVFTQLAPFDGLLGFVVFAWLSFVGIYALLVSFDEDGPAVRDRMAAAVVHSLGFLLLLGLVVVVLFTLFRGRAALVHLNFFVQDMRLAGPLEPLSVGGIWHAIVGTLEQIGIALAITVPLGVLCAVFLGELPGAFSRFVRTIVEAMTALPSIVAGLFIYATVVLMIGFGKSGFAASLAITVMMLPIVIRASDVVIRLVPGSLREASLALGASQWRTVWHVVLPTARSGLATAVILGTARGVGETSPVLLTAGVNAGMNANPFSGWQISLPLQTFEFVKSPQPTMIARGFGTAATLMVLVLVLFIVARTIGGRGPGQLTRRQARRRVAQSERDKRRFLERQSATPPATEAMTSPALPDRHREPEVDPADHREERDA